VGVVLTRANLPKEKIDDILLVGGSTYIPKVKELLQNYFKKEPKQDINADEVVAMGAAIQAAILTIPKEKKKGTKLEGIALLDVTPHNLGVAVRGTDMSVIIPANSKIPICCSGVYSPMSKLSTAINVEIYQGDNDLVKNNEKIAEVMITGIPRTLEIQIFEIQFKLNTNDILETKVVCQTTPSLTKEVTVNLNSEGGFSAEEKRNAIEENKGYQRQGKGQQSKDILIKQLTTAINNAKGIDTSGTKDTIQQAQDLIQRIRDPNCNITPKTEEEVRLKVKELESIKEKSSSSSNSGGLGFGDDDPFASRF